MKLIVGLGNPGSEYAKTRHNMGFDTIDKIINIINFNKEKYKYIGPDITENSFKEKYKGKFLKTKIYDKDVIFLKPQTYMNLSGECVRNFMNFYKIKNRDLIVIYDDRDIKPGDIKIRKNGSSGGHNGLKDVLKYVKPQFTRIRIGIGREEFKGDMVNYVLQKLKDDEYSILLKGVNKAANASLDILNIGIDNTMNKYNMREKRKQNITKQKNKENKEKIKNGKNKDNKEKINKELEMEKILITGHKNPDSDSIISSIVLGDLYTKLGKNVEAVAQGKVNKETAYVLKYVGVEAPRIETKPEEGTKVILVDHNNPMESFENLNELQIVEVIDHHAIKLETSYPLYYRAEPIGCTSSILYKMYIENDVEISEKAAKLMLSAIISDSLLFKSPTCTEEDKKIAQELEKIAGINANEYGLEMLKAGTDLSDFSAKECINLDAKIVPMGDKLVKIAQLNTADVNETLKRQKEFEQEMEKEIEEENLALFILAVTDIVNSNSVAVVLGDAKEVVEKSYGVKLENNKALLEGVVSRKKQIIPIIQDNI